MKTIIEPKVRGFICTTAHPEGCKTSVKEQIEFVKKQPKTNGAKRVLVIGASTGYGLASRISAAYSMDAATIGVIFDRPATGNRTASSGWYNTSAFETFAQQDGIYAKSINGDAFSSEIKDQTVELISRDLGTVDLVIYSLASPRRTMADGTVYSSVLKTTDEPYTNQTIDLKNNTVSSVTIEPASEQEIADTVKVMGGEDWKEWIDVLRNAGVLANDAVTVAYSYIGPELTHPMYLNGSIGKAKEHLYNTAKAISQENKGINAYISVNKALVTQSSAAIPIVPLYISILYNIMKQKGIHEGCIEQMYRLFNEKLYCTTPILDDLGKIRLDDYEMRDDVQNEVSDIWNKVSTENISSLADIDGYWQDFYQMFGFNFSQVDYSCAVETEQPIKSITV